MLLIIFIVYMAPTAADKTISIFPPKNVSHIDSYNDEFLFVNMQLPPNTNINLLVQELRAWLPKQPVIREDTFELPTRTISDYVEMFFYVLLTLIGGSINVYVLRKVAVQYRIKTVIEHKVC